MKQLQYVYDAYTDNTPIPLPIYSELYNSEGFSRIVVDSNNIPHIILFFSSEMASSCTPSVTDTSNFFVHITKVDGKWRYEGIDPYLNNTYSSCEITWDVVIDSSDVISIIYYAQGDVGTSGNNSLYRLYGTLYNWTYEGIGDNPFVIDGSTQVGKGLSAIIDGSTIHVVVTAMTSRFQNYGYNAIMYAVYSGGSWSIDTTEYHVHGYCTGIALDGSDPIFQTFRYYVGAPDYKPKVTFMKKHATLIWIEHLSYPDTVIGESNHQYMMEFGAKTGHPFLISAAGNITTMCYDWLNSPASAIGCILVYKEDGTFAVDPDWLIGQSYTYLFERSGSSFDYDFDMLKHSSTNLKLYHFYFDDGSTPTVTSVTIEDTGMLDSCMVLDHNNKTHIAYWKTVSLSTDATTSDNVLLTLTKDGKHRGLF